MILVNQTRVRGSNIQFDFKHKSKKLGVVFLSQNAINETNARRKAWDEVRKAYKNQKQVSN